MRFETKSPRKVRGAVGPIRSDKPFDWHLARVFVLFEDLRLEAMALYDDEFLARSGRRHFKVKAQKVYFLRRAIGTLREYVDALRLIDESEEFSSLRTKFPEGGVST